MWMWWFSTFTLSFTLLLVTLQGTTLITVVNRCNYTVWPAILGDRPSTLNTTGFELAEESSRSFQFPTKWTGRIWARTGCKLDRSGLLWCRTGDCGTGLVECKGTFSGPVTVAEFALAGFDELDFYDVSLVDGFNVPMNLEAVGGSGRCGSAGCNVDLNRLCPAELALKDGKGCMDACRALGNSEYCCGGAYGSDSMCRPNVYSKLFKAACPRSYSYSFDDSDATFTCNGGDFVVTFCPSSSFSSSNYSFKKFK